MLTNNVLNTTPVPPRHDVAGRIYLLHNPVFRGEPVAEHPDLKFRDPITVATSKDGYAFDTAAAVISCTQLTANSTCTPRYV